MNESLLRNFCETPHRKLIVAIVTIAISLVVIVPLVDDYFDKKESRRVLAEQLEHARQTEKILPAYEERMAQLTEELGKLETRSITEKSLSEYRSSLVNLVKEAKCRIRKLEVSTPVQRPWLQGDDPFNLNLKQMPNARNTSFTLERRTAVLSVDGTMEDVRDFLVKLGEDNTFSFARRVDLRSVGRGRNSVTLDIELWLFSLGRQKAT